MAQFSVLQFVHIVLAGGLLLLTGCTSQKEVSYKSGGMTQTFSEGKEAVPKELSDLIFEGATPTGSVVAERVNDRLILYLGKILVEKTYGGKIKWRLKGNYFVAFFLHVKICVIRHDGHSKNQSRGAHLAQRAQGGNCRHACGYAIVHNN